MPLQRCDGDGWRWGKAGKCYKGPGAKKKAIKQGLAENDGTLTEATGASYAEILEATQEYQAEKKSPRRFVEAVRDYFGSGGGAVSG